MSKKVLIIYKSVTGFTMQYAKAAARQQDCGLMELAKASASSMSGYDTVVFGGRLHAGSVDGLKKARELFKASGASRLIVFATGALPADSSKAIEQMWRQNLTAEELLSVPHFYMPGGLCYEKMPFSDRLMMLMFRLMMKRKKDKTDSEEQMYEAIKSSYDISSEAYLAPLIALLKTV